MRSHKLLISLTLVAAILGGAYVHYLSGTPVKPLTKLTPTVAKKYQATQIPTILVPGWGGGANAYNQLITDWQKAGLGGKVLQAQISPNGHVALHGHWPKGAVNPVIQVVFTWNFTNGYQAQVHWLENLLTTLKHQYGVTNYNAVAHSWGGSALLTVLVKTGQLSQMPKAHHLVFIGTPVAENVTRTDQLTKTGAPKHFNRVYRRLWADRDHLTANSQAQVTNIYGTIGQQATDSAVPIAQALSMRPLVQPLITSYHEIHAEHTNHHQLHTSRRMAGVIGQQLWGKWPVKSAQATVFKR